MSATLLGDVAAAIAAAIDAVDGGAGITYDGNVLKVYDYEPRAPDTLPAVTVDGPTSMRRPEPEERQSQFGSDDWRMTFTLRIYTKLDDPEEGARESRAILGQVIAAIDADPTLGGTADLGASVANASRSVITPESAAPMFLYQGDLMVWSLIP